MKISRREMVARAAVAAGSIGFLRGAPRTYRAAVIGRTGRGNYGHGLDLAFQRLANVRVVAVSDDDAAARERTRARTGAPQAYADWRAMLERERPDVVAIGPRWVVDRVVMIRAAADAGAHVYMEKPLCGTPEESDAIAAAAARGKIKLALAHQVRLAPDLLHLKKLVDGGLLGDLLEVRTRGKEDKRAGGEDLMVLGWHAMYLMRMFAGAASSCSARVTQDGRDVTAADRRAAGEPIGPIAGDAVHASYAFPRGVQGHFASQRLHAGPGGRFELTLYGSKGIARVHIGQAPAIYHLPDPLWSPGKSGAVWQPLPDAPGDHDPSGLTGAAGANIRLVRDLLHAVETGGEPVAGLAEGRAVLDMIVGVYAAHLGAGRVKLPLVERRHPLGSLS